MYSTKNLPKTVWRTFQNGWPPLGPPIEVQYGKYPPQKVILESECHCPGHGQQAPCYVKYGSLGQIHISYLVWRYL
jgi:hypothetical protein